MSPAISYPSCVSRTTVVPSGPLFLWAIFKLFESYHIDELPTSFRFPGGTGHVGLEYD